MPPPETTGEGPGLGDDDTLLRCPPARRRCAGDDEPSIIVRRRVAGDECMDVYRSPRVRPELLVLEA